MSKMGVIEGGLFEAIGLLKALFWKGQGWALFF